MKTVLFKSNKRQILLSISLIVSLFYYGCKNDIDIFTDYKEQAVIYGLIDLGLDVQHIRISRTFLNPNVPAKNVAQIPDSLYFDDLEVKLINEQSGTVIQLNSVDTIPKDTGFFQSQVNILFATDAPIQRGEIYRLEVKNPKTGYFASARTALVDRPIVLFPVSVANPNLTITPDLSIQLRFTNGNNAKSHDAAFEFWIHEFPKSDTTQKKLIRLDWRFAKDIRNESTTPSNRVRITPEINFYDFFKASLSEDETVFRRIIRTDFVLYSASQDLTDFVDASRPSIGIVQKQTDYSNIDNAIGVFTSRHTYRQSNISIDDVTIANFNRPDYKMLGIIR
jgi:hypothetical protein